MATWSAKSALQGSGSSSDGDDDGDGDGSGSDGDSTLTSCCLSPSLSPSSPLPTTTTTTTTSPTHDEWWDDSGFQDWEMQLGVTGEMTVVERLQYLLDTGQFADINIRVGQGNNATLFKAHKLLLATASQPLYRLVQQSLPSPGASDIYTLRITDMKPADFENILKYIYTDKVDCENINVAFGLLRASRKWGLAGLGIKSLTYLEEFVDNFIPETEESKNNLFDLLALSEDTLTELSGKCYEIILRHADTLIPCPGYLSLDKAMVQKVLCHPKLKINDQLKLFEAIRDWGLNYLSQNKLPISSLGSAVEEIIKIVDFEKISDSDFLSTVLTSECLGKAEVIAFFMTHGLEIPRKLDFNNNKELPFWLTFCATTSSRKGAFRGLGRGSKRSSISSTSSSSSSPCTSPSSLAPVNEGLSSICSLTQNGSVMEFNKVCRFKKGYRCPPNEIYMQHELRFRVDKNVKLLGVGFGFLFTPTDMGLNIHCQGPWETRQWTDIIQSYVRVSGEKQETADVRLMFLHPVRIEANQSYKVVVKMVRMSHGSNEVELWGGSGGVHSVETEDAEFFFIKAAVDPEKSVEESDGDTSSGVITALLYKLDTDEPEPPPSSAAARRRRRPVEVDDEATTKTNPWRHRTRNDSLKIPETPTARKRSPAIDQEAPPTVRRRERPPPEEYKPTTFATNRWGMRPKEEKEKPSSDDYVPSTFSTNRWARPRPKDETSETKAQQERKRSTDEYLPSTFSTNRWSRPRKDSEMKTEERKSSGLEEYKPSSFSTNRWTKPKEDKPETTTTRKTSAPEEYKPSSFSTNRWARKDERTDVERKTSAPEEYRPSSFSTNRWVGKSEKTDVERKTSAEEYKPSSFSTNRWARKDEKAETERKTSTEEYKPSSFSTNRWARKDEGAEPTRKTSSETTKPQDGVNSTPYGMRLRPKKQEEGPTTHPFARRRESRDTSADVPFYLRKNDDAKPPTASTFGRTRFGSLANAPSTSDASSSTTSKPAESTFHSRFLRSGAASSSPYSSSRFGSVRESSLTRSSLPRFGGSSVSRYDTPSSSSTTSSTCRKPLRYGNTATSSGSNLLALSTSGFGLSSNPSTSPRRDAPTSKGMESRYGNSSNSNSGLDRFGSPSSSGFGTTSNRYTTTIKPSSGSSSSSSRYDRASPNIPYTTSRYGARTADPGTEGVRYGAGSVLGRYSGVGTGTLGYTSRLGQGSRYGYGK